MVTHRGIVCANPRAARLPGLFSQAVTYGLIISAGVANVAQSAEPTAGIPSEGASAQLAGSRDGVLSLGVTFGSQAGPYGKEAAGFRYGLWDAGWTGLYFQIGHNKKSRKSAAGIHCELGFDVLTRGRTHLSLVPVVAYGLSVDKESTGDKETSQLGAALGLQLEVFLIESISTALRIEIGGQFEPAADARWSTASSEVLFYYHMR